MSITSVIVSYTTFFDFSWFWRKISTEFIPIELQVMLVLLHRCFVNMLSIDDFRSGYFEIHARFHGIISHDIWFRVQRARIHVVRTEIIIRACVSNDASSTCCSCRCLMQIPVSRRHRTRSVTSCWKCGVRQCRCRHSWSWGSGSYRSYCRRRRRDASSSSSSSNHSSRTEDLVASIVVLVTFRNILLLIMCIRTATNTIVFRWMFARIVARCCWCWIVSERVNFVLFHFIRIWRSFLMVMQLLLLLLLLL